MGEAVQSSCAAPPGPGQAPSPAMRAAFLRALLEGTAEGIYATDLTGRCTFINRAGAVLLGYAPEELLGEVMHLRVHHSRPDGSPYPQEQCEGLRVLQTGTGVRNEAEVLWRRDGTPLPVEYSAAPLLDGQAITGLVVAFRDISERKQSELEATERARLTAFQAEVGIALTESRNLRSALQRTAEALVRHLDAAFARVWVLDEAEQVLELRASAGLYTHLDGPHGRVSVGRYKIGLIAQERTPHLTNQVNSDPRVSDQEWAKREGMVAFAGYPLLVEDRLVGVMALFARRPLTDATLQAMAAVASGVALAVARFLAADERARALAEAETERKRLREVFTQAPALIGLTRGPRHVFVFANPLFMQTVGRREVLGKAVREAFPEVKGQGYFELLDRVYATGEPYVGLESRVLLDRKGDGALEEGYFNYAYQPIRSPAGAVEGLLIHAVEVTAQVRARQEVERLAAERAAILAQIADGVVVVDAEGRIVLVNETGRRLRGEGLGERIEAYWASGRITTLDGTPIAPEETPLARAVRRGETVLDSRWRIVRPDGAEVVVQGSVAPVVAEDGTRLGAVAVFRDVTAQHTLEQQKDEFLAAVSHDLKNPLASVLGAAQLMLRQLDRPGGPDPARLRLGLSSIRAAGERMAGLLEALLDVTRLRMERPLDLERAPMDLVALTRQVVEEQQQATERHTLRLESVDPTVVGTWDAARLGRVLGNLLGNAVKYSPDGGEVVVRIGRVVEAGDEWVEVTVQDQGLGIPAADLPRLFTRFHRGSNVAGRIAGTGIGLATAQQIVEQHGGSIRVESTERQGSTFTVRLPLDLDHGRAMVGEGPDPQGVAA